MSLLEMSFIGAVLTVVTLILRVTLLNRLPKRTFPAIWVVVILRLLLPFSIPLTFSVYSLWMPLSDYSAPAASESDVLPPTDEITPNMAPLTHETAMLPDDGAFPAKTVLSVIWLSGAVMMAIIFVIMYICAWRKFRDSLPEENLFITQWLSSHSMRRKVTVRCSDRISTPLTYGVLRPVILLPCSMDLADESRLDFVLTHEWVHICRFDALKKTLCILALCTHWFNPLVWVMFFFYNRDLELACDEGVVRRLGSERKSDYANTLIAMEAERSGFTAFVSGFGGSAAEERIRAIMKIKKNSGFAGVSACTLICAVAAAAVFVVSSTREIKTDSGIDIDYGATIAERWSQDWEILSTERAGMIKPTANVFSFNVSGAGKAVMVFCPEWKGCGGMLYILDEDGSIKLSEQFEASYDMEVLEKGSETILHMTDVSFGPPPAGDLKYVDDYYYNVSEDGTTLALYMNRSVYNGSYSGGGKRVDGNSVDLTEEEYNSEKEKFTDGYTVVKSVDFDPDLNGMPDNSFDFEDDPDGFAQYINDEKT